jgi:hypothetical protein
MTTVRTLVAASRRGRPLRRPPTARRSSSLALALALLAGLTATAPAAHAQAPPGILTGQVTMSASGNGAVADVTIQPGGLSFSTDSRGWFRLTLGDGSYQVNASRVFPAASATATATVTSGQVTTVSLVFPSPDNSFGFMEGRVYTQDILPVEGAAVRMFDQQGAICCGDFTDSNGLYQAQTGFNRSVPVGSYTVRVEKTGCETGVDQVTIYPSEKLIHDVQLSYGPGGGPPAPGAWAATGGLHLPRSAHTASLLPDGTVLVAGGATSAPSHLSLGAERFDPATGDWSWVGDLVTNRRRHTATTLSDGRILVTGGIDSSGNVLSSAEIFNPATGAWTGTGSMATPRFRHSAVALPDGRVLVAGGEPSIGGCEVELASAEIFNPATGTWTQTAGIGQARSRHTLTLLDNGKVLLAGGTDSVFISEFSGCQFNPLKDTRVFDPSTGRWSAPGSMGNARADHTATLLVDGRVLVAGTSGSFGSPGTAELFNPKTGSGQRPAA